MKYMVIIVGQSTSYSIEVSEIGATIAKLREQNKNLSFMIVHHSGAYSYIWDQVFEATKLKFSKNGDFLHAEGGMAIRFHYENDDAKRRFCGTEFQVLILPDRFSNYYYLRSRLRVVKEDCVNCKDLKV